jgi:hypothetical protein
MVRWEWLAENLFSRIHEHFGLRGLILMAAALIAGAIAISLRRMSEAGADALTSIFLIHAGVAVSSVHFLARPLAFTLFLFTLSLWIIERDRRKCDWVIWLLAPITALWVNLHGGYVGVMITLGVLAVGSAVEALFAGAERQAKLRLAGRYAMVAVACLAASCVNPYGWRMIASEIEYVRQAWPLKIIQEYQAPDFRSVVGMYIEALLVVGFLAAMSLARRGEYARALLILAWGHAALLSIRHAPLYFAVIAPLAAGELQRLWDSIGPLSPKASFRRIFWQLGQDHAAATRRTSVWPVVVLIGALLLPSALPWPNDFPATRNPIDFIARHRERLKSSRVFTTDDWSSYLVYHFNAPYFLGAFVNAYHKDVTDEYMHVIHGRPAWQQILDRYKVNTLLVPSESSIASLARISPNWTVDEDDGTVLLARRREN